MAKDIVVLAYSGGLDTSVCLRWLQDEKGLDIVAVVGEVGQEHDDLEITRINEGDDHRYCAILLVQTSKEKLDGALFKELNAIEDVTNIEEL